MRIILFVSLLALSCISSAQESRQIKCRLLSFGGNGDLLSVIASSGDGTELSCSISASKISDTITLTSKDGSILFLCPSNRKPFAKAMVPHAAASVLLVFMPNHKQKVPDSMPARVLVIEDTPKNFPDGGAFVANFYDKDIRFVIGEHKGMLHSAGMHGYALPKERNSFNMANVIFEFQEGEKWRNANESSIQFVPGLRYLFFAYADPVSGRPRLHLCEDMVRVATPAISKR